MKREQDSWIHNLPLLVKMLAAFSLVFLCFLATSVVSYRTFGQDDAGRQREGVQIELIRQVEEAIQDVRRQQVAIRNYLLGDGEQHLEALARLQWVPDTALAAAIDVSQGDLAQRLRRAQAQSTAWDWEVMQVLRPAAGSALLSH